MLKRATVDTAGEDRFGRTLARLTCVGRNANEEQVKAGMAWVYQRYAPRASPLYAAQEEARKARRGLWQADTEVPPWEWRRAQH